MRFPRRAVRGTTRLGIPFFTRFDPHFCREFPSDPLTAVNVGHFPSPMRGGRFMAGCGPSGRLPKRSVRRAEELEHLPTSQRAEDAMTEDPSKLPDPEELMFRPRRISRQRLIEISLGIVTLAALVLGFAFLWPLSRAHTELRKQFVETSTAAKDLRVKLKSTLTVLASTTKERDQLRAANAARAKAEKQRVALMQRIEGEIRTSLGVYLDKQWVTVKRDGVTVSVSYSSPVVFKPTGIDMSLAGKTALCKALAPLKLPKPVHVTLEGLANAEQLGSPQLHDFGTEWEAAASRSSRAVPMALRCGADPNVLSVSARSAPNEDTNATLRIVIQADPATVKAE